MTEQYYLHRKTGKLVKLISHRRTTQAGRFETLYCIEREDGSTGQYLSREFHRLYERVEDLEQEEE